jgi:hypothetical protein
MSLLLLLALVLSFINHLYSRHQLSLLIQMNMTQVILKNTLMRQNVNNLKAIHIVNYLLIFNFYYCIINDRPLYLLITTTATTTTSIVHTLFLILILSRSNK